MKMDEPTPAPPEQEPQQHHVTHKFWFALGGITLVILPIGLSYFNLFQEYQDLQKQRSHGQAHKFVVDKYLSCRSELFRPSADECIARLMLVARAKGADFEEKAGAAVRDLNLVN